MTVGKMGRLPQQNSHIPSSVGESTFIKIQISHNDSLHLIKVDYE